jgi:hypothetical protein
LALETPGDWVLVWLEEAGILHFFMTEAADIYLAEIPMTFRHTIVAEIAKPRRDGEFPLFVIRDDTLIIAAIECARIARELGPPWAVDPRNHFPLPFPRSWRGPYALHGADTYRIDTPECQILVGMTRDDDEDVVRPLRPWIFEFGVTRAKESAPPSDDQVAEIISHLRFCGAFVERTHLIERRHPSRRIFGALVGAHPLGTPWPEIHPLPDDMVGPPPGWEVVGSFRDRPLVFRIDGTELRVEWTPPPGVEWIDAAMGRAREPSRYAVSTTAQRAPTDEEVKMLFAMLGGATFTEAKRSGGGAKKQGGTRVLKATAAWLRKAAVGHS